MNPSRERLEAGREAIAGVLAALVELEESEKASDIRRRRQRYIDALRKKLIRMWSKQRSAVIARFLPALRSRGILQEAAVDERLLHILELILNDDADTWGETFEEIITQAVLDAGLAMATEFSIGGSFIDFPVQSVIEKLKHGTLDLVRGINGTTRNMIRTIISNGIENHQSYSAVAKLIRDRFLEFGAAAPQGHIRDRATLIAVDAIGQAYTDAQKAVGNALVDTGLTMEKAWQTVDDERVEPDCEENQAQGWIAWNETFSSGDDSPLAHPGCRCALLTRVKPS